ncbi:MAG TPA: DUF4372 domain-containing protein [Gammaproteobacteria bacterium]|nr:DUF4372 domain-containing protein [Gammaproteobacteria bacterium]
MAHDNTVFSQLLKFIPRHEFETLANRHHSGRSFYTASRWSQFVAMANWPGGTACGILLKIFQRKPTAFIISAVRNCPVPIYPASMMVSRMHCMKPCSESC